LENSDPDIIGFGGIEMAKVIFPAGNPQSVKDRFARFFEDVFRDMTPEQIRQFEREWDEAEIRNPLLINHPEIYTHKKQYRKPISSKKRDGYMSYESFIADIERTNDQLCEHHAASFGIKDTEKYMDKHGVDCSEMPCRIGCPFNQSSKQSKQSKCINGKRVNK
jgi:hypothetical protein